jgi:Raf kinase inhibitor-like YbhB/YbcL family protein
MRRALTAIVITAAVVAGCSGGGGIEAHESAASNTGGGTGMELTSAGFRDGGMIPSEYTCDGDDVSPPLALSDIPAGARSLALIMDDPDAPGGTWDHWVAYDVAVMDAIPEGIADLGTAGRNSWGRTGYGGPCPPGGTHRYYFSVYALDAPLGLAAGADKTELLEAMEGHILAHATLMGRYSR